MRPEERLPCRRGMMRFSNPGKAFALPTDGKPGVKGRAMATVKLGKDGFQAAVEKGGKLQIPASPTGQLAYVTNKASALPGPVTVEMPNMSGVDHNIAIQQGTSGPVLGASNADLF